MKNKELLKIAQKKMQLNHKGLFNIKIGSSKTKKKYIQYFERK